MGTKLAFSTMLVTASLFVAAMKDVDANDFLERAEAVSSQQLSTVFMPGTGIAIREVTTQGRIAKQQDHVAFWGEGCGLHVALSDGNVYTELFNPDYSAIISGRGVSQEYLNDLTVIEKGDYLIDNFWRADPDKPDWLQASVMMAMLSRYNNIGNIEFPDALRDWREKNGSYEQSASGPTRVMYSFKGWPFGTDGIAVYTFDTDTAAIVQIEAQFEGVHATLTVNEFTQYKEVLLPSDLTLTNRLPDGETLVKSTRWSVLDPIDCKFDASMCHFEYYGLPRPDLDALPDRAGSMWYLYLAIILMVVGVGWWVVAKL